MKIVSFNVNSVRVRIPQLKELIINESPDIIGLQETKVQDVDFPVDEIEALGYQVQFHGQKSHYGVAIMSKQQPTEVIKGFPGDKKEAQARWIGATFILENGEPIQVFNGYFPQGENRDHEIKFPAKKKFYKDLLKFLNESCDANNNIAVIGDMNIAPEDVDIGIGENNAKRWVKAGTCCFLPEEREWLEKLVKWGLVDTYREIKPDDDQWFSWFDYRSKGFNREPKRGLRIDLIMVTKPLLQHLSDVGINYEIRAMEKPSDHCPVWADFKS